MRYVDFHTHILPEMDDGAKDLSESLEMLRLLREQGVGAVCLTPHFYPYREGPEDFLERRQRSFSLLLPRARELGVRLVPASETFFTDTVLNLPDLSALCMRDAQGRRYLLTELPFSSSFSARTLDRISRLMGVHGVVPVLAHIERYPKLFSDAGKIDELIEMGCLMQMNLEALDGGFFQKRKALRYIRDNMIHVVGTDSHNTRTRPPAYLPGITAVERALGKEAAAQLSANARQIISGSLADGA
ncbi:MAG: hypothetical protein GX424_11490 [Clostridiales bacterium]|nr:hypothetical protein [Clostridiales bacterium]